MAQKKGQTGNPNGRPKGTPNKVTGTIKEWISSLIEGKREQMEADLEALEPKERLMIMERLMQYVVPKQQAIQSDVSVKEVSEDSMSETDIKAELERLRQLRNE